MIRTDKTLDIRGLLSPRAEIVIRNTLAVMDPGQVLTVVSTCKSIKQKMDGLCRTLGWALLEIKEGEGVTRIQIRK